MFQGIFRDAVKFRVNADNVVARFNPISALFHTNDSGEKQS
jgi:hypothetical protein